MTDIATIEPAESAEVCSAGTAAPVECVQLSLTPVPPSLRDDPPVVARLRLLQSPDVSEQVTLPQLQAVVAGLRSAYSLTELAADSGLSTDRVLDELVQLGLWCSHVWGASNTELNPAASEQLVLFQPPPGTDQPVTVSASLTEAKRDISLALAAVAAHNPARSDLRRYLDRRYPPDLAVLTFAQVAFVHRAAQLGRLDDLESVNEDNLPLARVFVAAFDLLTVAVRQARAAVRLLASADVSDLPAVRDATIAARFLGERRMAKIERLVDMAESSETSQGVALLAKELRFFGREVDAASGVWLLSGIEQLSDGQVLRIATSAGLRVEASTRTESFEIRRRLANLGLSADADRLVPEALRATDAGCADQFWEAMQRRADGDDAWSVELQAALRAASPV